jgi:sporulation integral membrane protein YtvI
VQQYQKYAVYFFKTLFVLGIVLLLYLFITRFFVYILPFILAWIIALLVNPLVNLLERKTRLPRGIFSICSVILFYALLTLLIAVGTSRLIIELSNILERLPQYAVTLRVATEDWIAYGQNIYINLAPETTEVVKSGLINLINSMSLLTIFPKTLLFVIVTMVSSYMMSKDMYLIRSFFASQVPEDFAKGIKSVYADMLKALGGFIRAQLTIMGITFLITITGLYLIGVPYALTMAIIIGVVDALPIFGTGAVIIPWAVINIIMKHYSLAVALLVLYGVIVVTRQIIEPKIMGKNIGLHPLATLISLYIGMRIFGIIGILIGPLTLIVIKALQKTSVIPRWKEARRP